MSIKLTLAKSAAKIAKIALDLTNREGSSLPGKMAQTIDKNVLKDLTADKKVILVTGTNGKTTTTALLSAMLATKYEVVTNDSGANMEQGIITTLILKGYDKEIAVLEIDEAYVRKLSPQLTIDYLVVTNVFDDQVDRLGGKENAFKLILEGVQYQPNATLVLNGDLPLMKTADVPNHILYFGKDASDVTYRLSDVSLGLDTSDIKLNHNQFTVPLSGMYNMYNTLAAYTVATELGVSSQGVQHALTGFKKIAGRQETIQIEGKDVVFNLVKNTIGFNAAVDVVALDTREKSVVLSFNDKPADGTDMSWFAEADFEQLASLHVSNSYYGGMYKGPLGERARQAGFPNASSFDSPAELLELIKQDSNDTIHIIANYTALYDIRNDFVKMGVIEA